MKSPALITTLAALSLAAGVGSSISAAASQDGTKQSTTLAKVPAGVDFRSSRWLDDRNVVNDNNEKIAKVSDLIVNRGSGRINYLVVKTGATLGLGGKTIAIPYSAFRWDASGENYLLASTPEQLKTFPEFSAKDWSSMMESKSSDKNELREKLAADDSASCDPYAGSIDTAKRVKLEGDILKVERVRTSTFGEQIAITVIDSKGVSQRVALGPSWYVNGGPSAPMRGDKVVVETLGVSRDSEVTGVAMNVHSGNRDLHLRGSDGTPVWAVETVETGGKTYSAPYWRNALVSSLRGMKVDCRGTECGKVSDVILDRKSGEIGFLSIDPDDNFLGIADTDRLIPWTVAYVALDGRVRVDASKEMVVASLETPSDLTKLNDGATAQMVYTAYQVPAPNFVPSRPTQPMAQSPGEGWNARGPIMASMDRKTSTTLTGTVVEVTDVHFDDPTLAAKALRINTGDKQETILLGPCWYMNNQSLPYKAGDTVSVNACRCTCGGKPYWVAHTVESKGTQLVLIDPATGPTWSQRDR